MTRWQQIEQLCDAALDCEAGQRAAFLADACAGDEQLRQEVESLLAYEEQGQDFLETPPDDLVAEVLTEATPLIAAGQHLSHYQVLSLLGSGGMGEVYLARDPRLERQVALKVLPAEFSHDPARVRRFTQEARAASALNHSNIVTLYDVGEAVGRRFMVMEYIQGRTLRALREDGFSLDSLAPLGTQIARALAVAHGAGIIHRDIKPDNLMVREDGVVKVLDFGLARLAPAALTQAAESVGTGAGILVGTVRYMSPEQAHGQALTSATDIFSLGIVFYELATGQHPFGAESALAVLEAISSQSPLPPAQLNPEIPSSLDALILRMLEKEARLRPTAVEVEAALTPSPFHPLTPSLSPSPRPRVAASPRLIVGRDTERAELARSFESAQAGQGFLLCVAGEPGIGKTTLVEDFLAQLGAGGVVQSQLPVASLNPDPRTLTPAFWIARGRCSERLAGAEAYLPWLEALDSLLRGPGREAAARAMKQLAPTWYTQVVSLSSGDSVAAELRGRAALSQERLKRELSALLHELARQQPLVLFFDDVHWADASTVDLLAYIGNHLAALPLLIVVAYRPTEMALAQHPFVGVKLELQSRGVCREVALEFLNRSALAHYLALTFPAHRFSDDFVALLHTTTEGSPLFLVDMVRDLRERHVIAEEEGGWVLTQAVPDLARELPQSVRGMIERKIAQLNAADRRLLVGASVQGYEFDTAVVAKALAVDVAEMEERLAELERVHGFVCFVAEEEFPDRTPTVRYRFVHVLYQNALYNSLQPTRKAQWSGVVAQALVGYYGEKRETVAVELAHLYKTAREYGQAADYYLVAAQRAMQVFAYAEAIVLAGQGLDALKALPDSPSRRQQELALQLALGGALIAVQGFVLPEMGAIFTRIHELSQQIEDIPLRLRALKAVSSFYNMPGAFSVARELAEQMLGLARRLQDPAALVWAPYAVGSPLLFLGEFVAAGEHFEQGTALCTPQQRRALALRDGWDPGVICGCSLATVLWHLGYAEQALTRLREALATAQEDISLIPNLVTTLVFAGWTHIYRREAQAVQQWAEATITLATDQGIAQSVMQGTIQRGWALVEQGRGEEGIAQLRQGIGAYLALGVEMSKPFYFALLAEACGKVGHPEEGLRAAAQGLAVVNKTGERQAEAELYRLTGQLTLQKLSVVSGQLSVASSKSKVHNPQSAPSTPLRTGIRIPHSDEAEAEAYFHKAIEIARRQAAKMWELRAAVSLSRLWQQQGKKKEAWELLAGVYGWFTEGFDTADLKEAKALLEELAR
ncbi:MAG: serine/threonine-protein kinase PknK [Candidatus Binatia bacterium]